MPEIRIDSREPRLFPEDQTPRLTAAVGSAIASQVGQVNGISHTPSASSVDGVAGLVRSLVNPKTLAAILEHLGHERKRVQSTIGIQCG